MHRYKADPNDVLLTTLQIELGAKIEKNKQKISVKHFEIQVNDIWTKRCLSDLFRVKLIDCELVQVKMLDMFYEGLHSKYFVKKSLEKRCKNVSKPVKVIDNLMTHQINLLCPND